MTEELGQPLPASPHAVSVSLPTWADNVGYEEGDARVIGAMRSGYPRFFIHPKVQQLFARAEEQFANSGERCFVFPSRAVAERAAAYVRRHKSIEPRLADWPDSPATVVVVPADALPTLKSYWQHAGQIVSSRWAEYLLKGRPSALGGADARQAVRERVAALLGAAPADVWLFPSGMAAIDAAHRAMRRLRPSARSVQFGFPYVDSLKLQEKCGAGAHLLPRGDAADVQRLKELANAEPLMGLFCEFPGNPLLASPDLRAIGALARAHDFPVLVDDTLGALVNVNVLPAADLVSTSLTKFFSGAGDVMAGSLAVNAGSPRADALRAAIEAEFEELLFDDDAVVLERNSRDCVERVRRINGTAEALCDFLRAHPAVETVEYPKYRTPELYDAFRQPGGGHGGLFSLLLRDPVRNAPRTFDALGIAKGPNLGTNFTLCCPYTLLAHYEELEFVERCGISRYLLRVSVGLEESGSLIERFAHVLDTLPGGE